MQEAKNDDTALTDIELSSQQAAIAVKEQTLMMKQPQAQGTAAFTLVSHNLEEAIRFATLLSESGMVPDSYASKPGAVLAAIVMGGELGVTPMQSLQNIANINGRPAIWGDLLLALAYDSGLMEDIIEEYDDQTGTATCSIKRKGKPSAVVRTWSAADSDRAGLSTKPVHVNYPKRMRQMRARAFALRDIFPDVLKGLHLREEVEDYQTVSVPGGGKVEVSMMPERSGTDRMVEEFNQGSRPTAAAPPSNSAAAAPAGNGSLEHVGILSNVELKEGVNADTKKPWKIYVLHFESGPSVATFSKSEAATARDEFTGQPCRVRYTVSTGKGGQEQTRLVSLEAADPEELPEGAA